MKARRGATLAELIVSFGILVPVVVVALGIFPFSHILNRRAWDLSTAYDLARTHLEAARAVDFELIPVSTTTKETRNGNEFTITVESVSYPLVQNPVVMKKVTVRVKWQLKKSEELQLDTLIIKPPSSS